jgi:hypothetical protein
MGCQILGFQFRDFAAHAPDELAGNEAELLELLADGQAIGKVVLVIGLGRRSGPFRKIKISGRNGRGVTREPQPPTVRRGRRRPRAA